MKVYQDHAGNTNDVTYYHQRMIGVLIKYWSLESDPYQSSTSTCLILHLLYASYTCSAHGHQCAHPLLPFGFPSTGSPLHLFQLLHHHFLYLVYWIEKFLLRSQSLELSTALIGDVEQDLVNFSNRWRAMLLAGWRIRRHNRSILHTPDTGHWRRTRLIRVILILGGWWLNLSFSNSSSSPLNSLAMSNTHLETIEQLQNIKIMYISTWIQQ